MHTIDIKALRENAGLSQTKLAGRIGKTQAQVSRYEENPGSVPWTLMLEILQAVGTDPATLLSHLPGDLQLGIDPEAPYSKLHRDLALLREYAKAAPKPTEELPENLPSIETLIQLSTFLGRKPNVIAYGPFDGGKSTVMNALLGENVLPTRYQPMTKVPTYVRHIEDRPAWFKEQVWLFDSGFNATSWDDQTHCESHRIIAGGIETLREHGTSQRHQTQEPDAYHAMVFIDSPLLRACNLVDLPGFDNDPQDTGKAENNPIQPDVAIYTSGFVGYMAGTDVARLGQIIRLLPPLEKDNSTFPPLFNLFVVATHAAPSQIEDKKLAGILDDASERVYAVLGASALECRGKAIGKEIDHVSFRKRFFTFYLESSSRRRAFEEDMHHLLTTDLPIAWRKKADFEIQNLKTHAKSQIAGAIESYQKILEDLHKAEESFRKASAAEPERRKRVSKKRKHVEANICEYKSDALDSLNHDYADIMDPDDIESVIRKRYKSRKKAQEHAANLFIERLRHRVENKISRQADRLSRDVEEYLEDYEQASLELQELEIKASIPFNAKGAFLGGMAGAAAVGALAAWAAALGNLGAYIIAAKAVSLLAALGISIAGGTAAVMSFIAVIGGPVTIAVAIVALLAVLGLALFGDSWQKRLSKKIVSAFRKAGLKNQFGDGISDYWDATLDAFQKGADEVEVQWQSYFADLESLVYDRESRVDRLTRRLESLEAGRDFFGGIPWRAPDSPRGKQLASMSR